MKLGNKLTKKQNGLYVGQNGGKFIDKGGFGCVVSPALKCSSSDKKTDKMVSKIVTNTDEDFYNELKISQILKKIDPMKKYYLTFEKYCYINNIPADRDDLLSVHYLDEDFSKFEVIGEQANKDKKTCNIELALKPVNLIMEYGGYSLSNIIKMSCKQQGTKAKMHQMFIDNLRTYLKHLILGLIKMHFNRIVNRDIKPHNILMNWNKSSGDVQIRYIDFGLSDFLSTDFCSKTDNITRKGTPTYFSPEIIVAYIVRKYKDRSESYIISKIIKEIEANVKKSIMNINEKELLGNFTNNCLSLYQKVKYLFDNQQILNSYYGTEKNKFNGYLQKSDVYALGLTIFIALYIYSDIDVRNNELLYDLLIHMIAIDPDKRYNAVQCLSHPYFHSQS